MELGKLNTLTKQIIDKTIQEAQTFKPEISADDQLKNFFANLYKEDVVNEENGNIEDMINNARTKREGLETSIKPSMGLAKEDSEKLDKNPVNDGPKKDPEIPNTDTDSDYDKNPINDGPKKDPEKPLPDGNINDQKKPLPDMPIDPDKPVENKDKIGDLKYKNENTKEYLHPPIIVGNRKKPVDSDNNSDKETKDKLLYDKLDFPTRKEMYLEKKELMAQEGLENATALKKDISGLLRDNGSLTTNLINIKPDNVVETLDAYKDLTKNKLDKETLTEAICDEASLPDSLKKEALGLIERKLKEKASSLGIDTKDMHEKFSSIIDDATSSTIGYISNDKIDAIDKIYNEYTDKIKKAENDKLNKLDRQYADKKFNEELRDEISKIQNEKMTSKEKAIFEKYEDIVNMELDDVAGNGKFDNDSKQMIGNCWLHATVNSLRTSEAGQKMMNEIVSKKEGVTSIVIPEERYNGEGQGIYTYNEPDIIYSSTSHSLGDGDMTALSMAVDKYLKSTGVERGVEGNTCTRGYELLTGKTTKMYNDENIPTGIGFTHNINDKLYRNMKVDLTSGKAAFTTDFEGLPPASAVDKDYNSVKTEPVLLLNHEYAVHKMDNDYIYLQESNQPQVYIKIAKKDFIDNARACGSYKFE